MRKLLRNWLGYEDLEIKLSIIESKIAGLRNVLDKVDGRVGTLGSGLGRILAKLDPMFGSSEQDPKRKAESDKLGEEIIKKLEDEAKARRHTEGVSE